MGIAGELVQPRVDHILQLIPPLGQERFDLGSNERAGPSVRIFRPLKKKRVIMAILDQYLQIGDRWAGGRRQLPPLRSD